MYREKLAPDDEQRSERASRRTLQTPMLHVQLASHKLIKHFAKLTRHGYKTNAPRSPLCVSRSFQIRKVSGARSQRNQAFHNQQQPLVGVNLHFFHVVTRCLLWHLIKTYCET